MSTRQRRRLEPLPAHVQAAIRHMITQSSHGEDVARTLQLPISTLMNAAAGARMLATTRRRIASALERHGRRPTAEHLRLVPPAGPEPLGSVIDRIIPGLRPSSDDDGSAR